LPIFAKLYHPSIIKFLNNNLKIKNQLCHQPEEILWSYSQREHHHSSKCKERVSKRNGTN